MQNILVLEDDIQLSDTIKQFLEYSGYMVYPAYDASQAKDILYEKSIDLMLLDVKVPHQNGFDFLQERRDSGDTTPAIFVTSLNAVDDVTQIINTRLLSFRIILRLRIKFETKYN